jgi:uncharacterized protein (TIGR03083 family)
VRRVSLDYLACLRADSARFAEVLADIDPGARVPTCPDWTAADLLWHLGEVQHFWGTIVRDRLTDVSSYEEPARPDAHQALLDFFAASSALLIDALASTADEVAVWTWFDDNQSVGFVRRRQAHEAFIHRLDPELTAGAVTELDAGLATDGVLEAIEWMLSGAPGWASITADGPIGRLATTDTGASWLVQVGHWTGTSANTHRVYTDDPMLLLVEDGEPSFEVTGTARDLDAWMWNRPTLGEIRRAGDTSAFEAMIRQGVQ